MPWLFLAYDVQVVISFPSITETAELLSYLPSIRLFASKNEGNGM